MFTFKRPGVSSVSAVRSTSRIHGLNGSNSSAPAGPLSAMARSPSSVACFAAATVPECQIALPRLKPRFNPDRTTSTFPRWCAPSATQSAGVPFTR